MKNKLIIACMAMAALAAFALPASASATNDPQLTDAGGTVAVGSKIIGTLVSGTSADFMATDGTTVQATCNTAVLTATVIRNAGGAVEGTISLARFSGSGPLHADNDLTECTGNIGNSYMTVTSMPLCLHSAPSEAEDEFHVHSSDCNEGEAGKNLRFLIGSTVVGECEYETTGSGITGTFTTNGTVVTLKVNNTQSGSGSKKIRGGVLCPSSGQLRMEFNLYTDIAGEPPITVS